ncbi:MAG: hypothetical protein LBR53_05105 [Deltaproteobacteria bacterium]|nr:hypothetical protein [Deltaproteobacteria bacterium]
MNARDLAICEKFLSLAADDTFEPSFIESKLAKDFKVKEERVRYAAVKTCVIVILEANRDSPRVREVIERAYGPEAFPTESEIRLVRPRLSRLASLLDRIKASHVVDVPYFYYLIKL